MRTKDAKRYSCVDEMLRGIELDSEFVGDFNQKVESEILSAQLQQIRVQAGLTQRELGERLGITQGAVSKIEHKADDDLTLKEIGSFLASTSSSMHLRIGSPQPKAEQIKHHAFEIRRLLDELAETAGEDGEIKQGVQDFWMEVVVNLTSLLSRSKAVPHDKMKNLFSESVSGAESTRVKDLRYDVGKDPVGV